MERSQIYQRLANIGALVDAGDFETAHKLEDLLFMEVLGAISKMIGAPGERPQDLARLALRSLRMYQFKRRCGDVKFRGGSSVQARKTGLSHDRGS